MVGHDDKGVQGEAVLRAMVKHRFNQQIRASLNLEEAAAIRSHAGDEVRAEFLRSRQHVGRIDEKPRAEALLLSPRCQGPEGPCSLRVRASRDGIDPLRRSRNDLFMLQMGEPYIQRNRKARYYVCLIFGQMSAIVSHAASISCFNFLLSFAPG